MFEHPGELAHQLESLPQAERAELWASISVEDRGAAIPYLHDEIKAALLEEASLEELQDLTENMAAGDVADVLDLSECRHCPGCSRQPFRGISRASQGVPEL